jgi:mycothiol synthase
MTNNFIFHSPTLDDAQQTLDLMIRCDIAYSGEADSEMEDLVNDWENSDLSQDAWLVLTSEQQVIGYAAVMQWNADLRYDIYVEPTLANDDIISQLLSRCEASGKELATRINGKARVRCYVISGNQLLGDTLSAAGFQVAKYIYNMQAKFDAPPAPVKLPEGITLRNPIPGQDDRKIYEVIQSAFERPGRTAPSFEDWKGFALRPDIFKPELWFLAMQGEEMVGACLSYAYSNTDQGWVRQLGVLESVRRTGLGSALLQHAFIDFYKLGFKKVGLAVESDNPRAIRFYENVGMQQVRRIDEYIKAL